MGTDRVGLGRGQAGRLSAASAVALLLAVGLGALPAGGYHSSDVTIVDNAFEPPTIHVRPGTTVVWTHIGNRAHTVTADDASFDSSPDCETSSGPDCLHHGDSYSQTFTTPGTYPYYCKLHGAAGGVGMAGVVVVSNDPPEVRFPTGAISRSEGDSGDTTDVTPTVTLSFDTDTEVTVDYTIAPSGGQPATEGADYEIIGSAAGQVVIPAGETSVPLPATIRILGDDVEEPDETLTVTLSDPTGATLGDPASLVLTIEDDDGAEPPPPPQPPVADAGGPYTTDEETGLTLDGSASSDPDGTIVAWAWDLDHDGVFDDAVGPTPTVVFPDEGAYPIALRVQDDDLMTATDETTVTVRDIGELSREQGADRYGTAMALARRGWTSAHTAVLATGEDYADALAGAPLAARYDAPLLLTPRSHLPQGPDGTDTPLTDLLSELGVRDVIILGGTAAVSDAIEATLRGRGFTTRRIAGATRFDTAAMIAGELGGSEVLLALGQHADPTRAAWPDALAAGALSGAGLPILLTHNDVLPDATAAALTGVGRVWLVGGTAAIPEAIEAQVRARVPDTRRLAGPTRYATSVAVASEALGRLPDGDRLVVLATGGNFPDGLAAGALAAHLEGVLLLAHPTDPTHPDAAAVRDFLHGHAGRFDHGVAAGGTAALSAATVTVAAADMRA